MWGIIDKNPDYAYKWYPCIDEDQARRLCNSMNADPYEHKWGYGWNAHDKMWCDKDLTEEQDKALYAEHKAKTRAKAWEDIADKLAGDFEYVVLNYDSYFQEAHGHPSATVQRCMDALAAYREQKEKP